MISSSDFQPEPDFDVENVLDGDISSLNVNQLVVSEYINTSWIFMFSTTNSGASFSIVNQVLFHMRPYSIKKAILRFDASNDAICDFTFTIFRIGVGFGTVYTYGTIQLSRGVYDITDFMNSFLEGAQNANVLGYVRLNIINNTGSLVNVNSVALIDFEYGIGEPTTIFSGSL